MGIHPTRRRRAADFFGRRAEALGVRLLAGVFGFLPLDLASELGGRIARLLGPRLGITNVARDNLRQAFADLPEEEISQIVKAMWENLGRVAAEYPHLKKIRVFATGGRVETHGLEHMDQAIAAGRRMIIFSGHLANWEIAALAAVQYGISIVQIYRAANNPLVDRMVLEFRGKPGGFAAKGSEGARRAVMALRQGVHLALLADQKMNDGIAVPFFGRKAMTAPALAALALRFDCDVLPARVERLSGARFRLTVHPPLTLPRSGSREADIAQLMAAVNAKLEEWIRERPADWLWLHRRWGN